MKQVGIDLGTTNTVGAIEAEVLQHPSGPDSSPVVPSVVAFPPSGATLVGTSARTRRAIDPKNTIFSAKRIIGQPWSAYATTKFRKQYPFELRETSGGGCAFRTRAGTFTPSEIGARIVGKLLSSHGLKPEQYHAVITVPAAFDEAARKATVGAAEAAGFAEASTLEEPVATALAYKTVRNENHKYVAVYDLGGGTFDLAILDCSTTPAQVVGHAGDAYLGGDDIDQAIANWVAQQVLEEHGWDLSDDPQTFDRLVVQCERAKIRLCVAPSTRIEMSQVDPAAPLAGRAIEVERDRLRELCSDLVTRTFILCDQVLRGAHLNTDDIHAVYLAGGTTMLPFVREGVAQYFGSLPRCDFDPMEVVSIGASLHQAVSRP